MDATLRKLKPAMMEVLKERKPAQAEELWITIENQYLAWKETEGNLGGKKNMMSSNMLLCYAMCAFYDAIDRQFSEQDMEVFVNKVMGSTFRMLRHLDMNRLENNHVLMSLAYRYLENYTKKSDRYRDNAWGNTWKVEVNPENRNIGIAYHLHTCPLYDFAKKYGYMELLPYMCNTDSLVAEQFHARLIRHRVLSEGDDVCEYWYVGDKSIEAKKDRGEL